MDRMTQEEERQFQMGRRDAIQHLPERSEHPFYLDGWREGKLELLRGEPVNET